MKIVEMRVTPIAVGDPPLLDAAGPHAPCALRTPVARFGGGGTSARKDVQPWATARINPVWSAIEVACFDLMGKAIGRPVVDLLGGVVREHVPCLTDRDDAIEMRKKAPGWAFLPVRYSIPP